MSPRRSAPATAAARSCRRPRDRVRNRLAARLREDSGTITILLLGVLVVILMVIGVGAAITGVHLQRTELQHAADGAALAASQAIESGSFYGSGAAAVTPRSARSAARDHLERHAELSASTTGVAIEDLAVGADGTVRLTVTAHARPPLIGWFLRGAGTAIPLTVVGEAHAS